MIVARYRLMGIVNVTPDSFSDGGLFLDPGRAVEHARALVEEGADLLDVGGESTRPGARAVSAAEELERVGPVLECLLDPAGAHAASGSTSIGAPVSIDTSKVAVAEVALGAGAEIVNDVTAFRAEPQLAALCAERGCGVVLMHMQGTPRTMQENPVYDDVVDDVKGFLAERIEFATGEGIAEDRIWVDPGIGFGKTVEHNLELLRRLGELGDLGRPILVGASRKSFIGRITGRELDERVGGTIAASVMALVAGAEVLRVHDVAPVREALEAAEAILGRRAWKRTATFTRLA
jgi:dihydropteroate synthase